VAEAQLVTASTPHRKPLKRLTDIDKAFALRYSAEGLTQVEIAQRLGCDQATISRWLSACQDTTAEATAFFRGQALAMAEKVVKKGRPSDHIKALQGVNVLTEERSAGLVIQIGGGSGDVKVAVMTTFAPKSSTVSVCETQSTGDLGSDNRANVNQLPDL
jgi:transposase-like protein